jgi:hypothetical protein
VTAIERLLSVSDVATVTDMAKLEAVARWQAWRLASAAASGQYDVKSGTSSLTRSQFFDHIAGMLCEAARAAIRYPEVAVLLGGGRRPTNGLLTTTAPVTPACGPDPNDPAYSGSPLVPLRRTP